MGISDDTFALFRQFILGLLGADQGASDAVNTPGNAAVPVKFCANMNRHVPLLTIQNQGTTSAQNVYVSYGGVGGANSAGYLLAFGATLQLKDKYPAKCNLVITDTGTPTRVVAMG